MTELGQLNVKLDKEVIRKIKATLASRGETIQSTLGALLTDWSTRGCPLSDQGVSVVHGEGAKGIRGMTPEEIAKVPQEVYNSANRALQDYMVGKLEEAEIEIPDGWVVIPF